MRLKRLNGKGLGLFGEYLDAGAEGAPPVELLDSPATSESVSTKINLPEGVGVFPNRYVFGNRLNNLLKDLDPSEFANDRGFWSALALYWFDALCPPGAGGKRKPSKDYYYILSTDYRHYYRHLIRSPWQLVRQHGKNAQFLLISPRESKHPLSIHGEILENFAGRQQVLASKEIIEAANHLYFDTESNRPKRGVAGKAGGSARRFGLVFRQFDLTYDMDGMPTGAINNLLPSEFYRWKKQL